MLTSNTSNTKASRKRSRIPKNMDASHKKNFRRRRRQAIFTGFSISSRPYRTHSNDLVLFVTLLKYRNSGVY